MNLTMDQIIIWGALLFLLGLALGWLIAARFSAKTLAEKEREAGAADAKASELAARLESMEQDTGELRGTLAREQQQRVEAQTRFSEAETRIQEERRLLREAEARLTDTFKALAQDALSVSGKSFHDLAKASLEKLLAEAKGEFGKSEKAIEGLVAPLGDALKKYEGKIDEIEGSRKEAYGSLSEQLRSLGEVQAALKKETGNLVSALKSPQVRGRWGELTLKKVVELAGLSQHCDFTEQLSLIDADTRLRPDLVVHLPSERNIAVDSKVPLRAFLEALEADTDEARSSALERHAKQVREHINRLAKKDYWSSLEQTPEFVVMFIPGESFFAAALARDPELIKYGVGKKVVLATPTTLITLLWSVARGWQEVQMAESAKEVAGLGKQLHERLVTFANHLDKLRGGLMTAARAYNDAVGSLERRVLPSARRFKEMGIGVKEDIPLLESVDEELREHALREPEEEEG